MTSPEVPVTLEQRALFIRKKARECQKFCKGKTFNRVRDCALEHLKAAREEALEEAAKVAEHCEYHGSDCCACTLLARQIRALKTEGL